ncbi:MAG: glycosyltransferase [Vicinamibacteria bacterium]|nr:glycosyltransferase [Vicinamibacteria bacterium]
MKLGFVLQRYGEGITGGSESLARALAERFAREAEVTVFTSCARDYVTWRNELAPGRSHEHGVEVLRFESARERDLDAFNAYSEPFYLRTDRTPEEERDWLVRQGPFVPGLVEELARRKGEFDAILFFTYLYYPTCEGLRVAPERAVLVPTTHDEPPLRFSVFREVFDAPRAFAFLTPAEERLVRSRFELGDRPGLVAGMGVEAPPVTDVLAFRTRHDLLRPYALYAGRIDAGKGCDEMIAFHAAYRRAQAGGLDLVLLGKLAMPEPREPGVRHLGFVSEQEKWAAFAGASAVVCPSPYESLSIVLLEGMAQGVPALVNGRSDVLVEHCRRSNAGLWYETAEEFGEALDLLARGDGLRQAMAQNARRYVAAEYRWDVVMERYRSLIAAARGSRP